MCEMLTVSERRACRVLGQVRRTQRYTSILSDDETVLVANVVSLATEYGRYGYRRITALLRADGWLVNHKRVERIWRQEGLKVPARQAKRGRLWFNDGSCIRLRPEYRNHVWAYDFVFDRTGDGRQLKFLTVVDEYSRQCLAIDVHRKQTSREVLRTLAKLMLRYGVPKHIRPDNGPEFVARTVRGWQDWVCKRCLSSLAAPGRTATSKALTVSSEMNYLTVRSFRVCRRRRCWPTPGGGTTITADLTAHWVIGHPHR